jgi:hypothetical protein
MQCEKNLKLSSNSGNSGTKKYNQGYGGVWKSVCVSCVSPMNIPLIVSHNHSVLHAN